MNYKPNKLKFETVKCRRCKQSFERLIRKGNTKEICDRPDCKKLKTKLSKLGNEKPVTFDDLPSRNPTKYTADIQYHGRPNV